MHLVVAAYMVIAAVTWIVIIRPRPEFHHWLNWPSAVVAIAAAALNTARIPQGLHITIGVFLSACSLAPILVGILWFFNAFETKGDRDGRHIAIVMTLGVLNAVASTLQFVFVA